MRRPDLILALALALACALGAATHAHAAEPRGGFLLLAPTDTVMVERFVRSPGRLEAAMLYKLAKQRFTYTLDLRPDESVSAMSESYWPAASAPGAAPEQQADLRFVGDSCIADLHHEGVQRLACSYGAVPFVNPSVLMMEQTVKRAIAMRFASNGIPMFFVTGGKSTNIPVTRVGVDSVVLQMGRVDIRLHIDRDGDVLGGTIPLQGLTIQRRDTLSEGDLVLQGADYSAPAGAPYTAAEVRVPSRHGFALAGTLTSPKAAGAKVPVVVTITGSGAEARDEDLSIVKGYRPFREVADALSRHGIAVLRMDDRGFGSSGGRFKNSTTADFAEDIEDAVRWLRARPGIDPARVALVGHSEGGMIAPIVASRDPQLRAIVLLAGPAYSGRRILEYQNLQAVMHTERAAGPRRDSLLNDAMAQVDTVAKNDAWLRWFRDHDPLPTAKLVMTPVLILQGATDHQVTPEQAELLEKAFREGGNRDVTRRVFPATNHLFVEDSSGLPGGYARLTNPHVRREVLLTLTNWLQSKFGMASASTPLSKKAKRARK